MDISLTPSSIIVLFPLIAVLGFLFIFVGPWMANKMSTSFFGGGQMDRRGPGPSARLWQKTRGRGYNSYRDPNSGSGRSGQSGSEESSDYANSSSNSGSGYGGGYNSNNPSNDDDQFFLQDSDPTTQQFAPDDAEEDNEDNDDDDDDDDE